MSGETTDVTNILKGENATEGDLETGQIKTQHYI